MSDKQTIVVDLAGSRYRMTSDADGEHLLRLAEIVNKRIEGLGSKAARSASPAQLLAVVAMGLADDLVSSEERRARVEDLTRRVVTGAIERIDERLATDALAEEDGG
ncbi:MAG: cell division protein ZapA [Myxococcota bacterium]